MANLCKRLNKASHLQRALTQCQKSVVTIDDTKCWMIYSPSSTCYRLLMERYEELIQCATDNGYIRVIIRDDLPQQTVLDPDYYFSRKLTPVTTLLQDAGEYHEPVLIYDNETEKIIFSNDRWKQFGIDIGASDWDEASSCWANQSELDSVRAKIREGTSFLNLHGEYIYPKSNGKSSVLMEVHPASWHNTLCRVEIHHKIDH